MIRWLAAVALLVPFQVAAKDTNQTGERAFERCYSCHSVTRGEKGLSGPNLHALKGRPIASDPDFTYSKGFKNFARKSSRWNSKLLDRFLADPEALAPGNEMGFFGLKDVKERAAIVAYIMAK